jgi:phosphatidylglycerophosphatase C
MASGSDNRQVVAVFDFDGTITFADSFLPFLRHQAGFVKFWIGTLVLCPFVLLQAAGLMSNSRAKEKFLKFFLSGKTPESLAAISRDFVADRLPNLMNPLALEKVEWHRREGHALLLLSASPELYLRFWTAANGFEKLLGTRLKLQQEMISGRIEGDNCHGKAKVVRLKEELGDLNQYELYSYGDSRSDRHVLEMSAHPGFRSFGSEIRYRLRALFAFARALI